MSDTVTEPARTIFVETGEGTDLDLQMAEQADIAREAIRSIVGPITDKPNERPRFVPPDDHFDEETGFLESRELEHIGRALITHYPEFGFLINADARIAFVWKRKGGTSNGQSVFGKCQKPSGLLKHYSACDFVIWIAADHVREAGYSNLQLEALLYHECGHMGYEIDEKTGEMKLAMRAHDHELFWQEFRRYGAWNEKRRKTGEVYAQVGLLAADNNE